MQETSITTKTSFHPCPLCGSEEILPVSERSDASIVTRCVSCQLEFVNPIPDDTEAREMYDIEDVEKNQYYEGYIKERQARLSSYARVYNKRLDKIEALYPAKGNILDIGCAAGFFLKIARERGWKPYGVDIVPFLLNFAKETLKLENLYLNTNDETGYDFPPMDVITLWDLIEHLRTPHETLNKLNASLKDDGLLVIWTPNAKNAAFVKEKWFGYDMDQHLYFFTPETATQMLKKNGFEVLYLETNHTKKGFFPSWCYPPLAKKKETFFGKILYSIKRNGRNVINPCNLISPILDKMGYGFNIYLIAKKVSNPESNDSKKLP